MRLYLIEAVNTEADAVFRRTLGDQHYADPGTGHTGEQTTGHADHALHARARDVDHGHADQIGDALDLLVVVTAFGADQRAFALGVAGVLDQTGNMKLGDGRDSLGMQHLGTEVRQLHRFFIRQLLEQLGIRHQTRVAVIDAVYVGPDFAALGINTGGQHGGGVVGAVTAQNDGFAFLVTGGKARHQVDTVVAQALVGKTLAGHFDINVSFEEAAFAQQHGLGGDHLNLLAARLEQLGHGGDRECLAPAQNVRLSVVRALLQQADALQQTRQLTQLAVNPGLEFLAVQ